MNNVQMLINMMKNGGNPQTMLQNMFGNSPMSNNVMNMIQQNDAKGLEMFARNMAKERGVDVEQALAQIRQFMN